VSDKIKFKCPQCGTEMEADPGTRTAFCVTCSAAIDVEAQSKYASFAEYKEAVINKKKEEKAKAEEEKRLAERTPEEIKADEEFQNSERRKFVIFLICILLVAFVCIFVLKSEIASRFGIIMLLGFAYAFFYYRNNQTKK